MSAITQIIAPRRRDLGGFEVARVLPYMKQRSVGPFVFFDHLGPAVFAPGQGIDVRPHPHIGLATVTYLFEGDFMHRDSLGSIQLIRPGDMNWMTPGRGIVHSERTTPEARAAGHRIHGIQSWVALPKSAEMAEPKFTHHPASILPTVNKPGVRLRVIAGSAFGVTSPVEVLAPTIYLDVALEAGGELAIPAEHKERAIYTVDSPIKIDGEDLPALQMAVLAEGKAVTLSAAAPARVMVLGGDPLDAPRQMWWNFVSSSDAEMERAKADWARAPEEGWTGRFKMPPGEQELIPLPEL